MTTLRSPFLREPLVCAALAAAAAAVAVFAPTAGGDLAAHVWRTSLVQHGVVIWDNLWFGGEYPLASYSLLYYVLAAFVGNAALGVLGVVIAAAVFSSILEREWPKDGRWAARAFAVLLAGQAFTAAYPYDLGLAAMLGTLWALQRRRLWIAGACTVLTLLLSPLAFLFLGLALVAVWLWHRRVNRQAVVVALCAALAAGLQLTALVLLPSPGMTYPYGWWRFLCGLALVVGGVVLSFRGRAGWRTATLFLVWGAASVLAFAVPSPVGHNLVRASEFLFPLMLVTAKLADFRPRWLALSCCAGALAANVLPYAPMIAQRTSIPDAKASFWAPAVAFLHSHLGAGYRVEVVPTANHWEASFLPQAGIPLARGWYRQLDIADNEVLYAHHLTASTYERWLRSRGVRYVVVPRGDLEAIDATREAALVRSSLRVVWADANETIFSVPHPLPLLTGPGRATITRFDASQIDGVVSRPGTYLLRVNYTPYWSLVPHSACLARAGSATSLRLPAGPFSLRASESPLAVLATNLEGDSPTCR